MSYKVRQGDTLSSIALRNNVSVGDLMKANPQIKNPDKIITGWVLNLPMTKPVPGKQGDGFAIGTAKPPRTGPNLDGASQPLSAKPMSANGTSAAAAAASTATPAPAAPPAGVAAMQTARANNAATVAPADVAQMSATAQKNEATVMAGAKQLAQTTDPAAAAKLYTQLKADYGTWQGSVQKLVQNGQLGDPAVKSFASKSEQAATLQNNLPPDTQKLTGAAYSKAVEAQIANDCVATKGQTAKGVTAGNPLLDVPPLGSKPSIEAAKAKGIATTNVTIEGKTAEVRKDVVMVFAPGVVRTGKEFTDMRHEAMDDGIASTRAETGTFIDPDKNAEAIATAIKQAKDMVGNPNAKVLLVGYSQGNTNVYAFMRDKDGKYGDLTKDVVGIHDIHSAARGSDLADMAFAVGQYLTTPDPLDPHQQQLVDAYCRATAKTMHLPEGAATVFQGGMKALRTGIQDSGKAISALENFASPLLAKIGIHAPTNDQINKGLMKVAIDGTKIDDVIKAHGGKAGAAVADAVQPFLNALKDNPAEWLRHPTMSPMFQKYVDGGLKSLTTDYGGQLMTDPKLQQNVKNVAILNSVGSIPQEREQELVPNSQKLLFNFFHELGQDNDYEVSLQNQKLEAVVPHAVDLPADAIGHWGVTGVTVPYDHGPEYFKNWKPGGMTDSVLTTFQNMGVILDMGDNRIGNGPRPAPLTPAKTDEKPKAASSPPAAAPSKGGWGAKTVTAAKTGLGGMLARAEGEAAKLLGNTEAGAQKLIASTEKESARLLGNVESEVGKVGDKATTMADAAGRTVTNLTGGLPQAVGSGLRSMFDYQADQNAFRNISNATPQQLASMSNADLAKTAQELLNPSIPEKLFGASSDARSQQALRLLTAHGSDAGSMDAIATKLPYLRDPGKELTGPAAAQYKQLQQLNKAHPGDWSGLQEWMDKATGTVNRPGTTVTPLINGQNAFPEMYKAIDGAKSSVNYTVFAFESDKTGWEMAQHLADAAKRGVDVKLVYDPMGSAKTDGAPTDQKIYQFMKDAGVQVIAQKPGPLAEHLTHRKITVVDGKTGFIGGMNCGENYSTKWHDCHSKVEGQGVADLQKLFVEQWKGDGGKVTPQEEKSFFPPLSNVGTTSARMVGHVGNDDQNMKLAYLRSIDTAQKQINIASPYFSDPDVVTHLKDAVKRGVDVSVVLPKTNNQKVEQDAERAMYKDMIAGGIKVYEYAGRPMAHDKVATFDGKLATIGSSNLDARSLGNNDEANVWSDDPKVAATLNEQLFGVDKTQSHQITAQEAAQYRTVINEAAEAVSSHL